MKNFKSFMTAYRNCTFAIETTEKLEKSFEKEISNVSEALITEVYSCRAKVLAQMLEVQYTLNDEFNEVCPQSVAEAKAQQGFVCKEFFASLVQYPDLVRNAKEKLLSLVHDMVENLDEEFEIDENVAEVIGHITASDFGAAMAEWRKSEEPISLEV